ncbi:hypothetical protein QK402_30700 [Pseudomonas aeruginosa]|nr:hypothetical protein [Pseudomonas aeruginosa]MDI4136148.1 hypothetical protein [Pseudomonas aeruginosa]MDI4224307.1 hypothetical protein [Pseudomonas aeruginosa]MDI4230723.1 hypothetical protein [Pseudomonas aeruginosa]
MADIGEKINKDEIITGAPPILFQLQPEGYRKLTTQKDIQDWENRLREYYGIDAKSLGNIVPLDTCSGGRADDCGGGGPS